MLPEPLKIFIEKLSRLPSVGPRLAARIGLHLASLPEEELSEFRRAFEKLGDVNRCPHCFSLKPKSIEYCQICTDKSRDTRTVMILEKETDVEAVEKSGAYRGLYLVVGEAPHNGVLPEYQKNRLRAFKNSVSEKKRVVAEIVIALPQNAFGDFLSESIRQGLKGVAQNITRIARGIPTGGTVEFADEETLKESLKKRG